MNPHHKNAISQATQEFLRKRTDDKPISTPHGITARFDLLTPRDLSLCDLIAQRCAEVVKQWMKEKRGVDAEVHPQIIGMDIAIAHLTQRIDLERMLAGSIEDVMSDFALIQQNINRVLCSFPSHVKLKFHASILQA